MWISITRLGSMYEEQMDTDQRDHYRHRPRRLVLGTLYGSEWRNGRAPDNPYWNKKEKLKYTKT